MALAQSFQEITVGEDALARALGLVGRNKLDDYCPGFFATSLSFKKRREGLLFVYFRLLRMSAAAAAMMMITAAPMAM